MDNLQNVLALLQAQEQLLTEMFELGEQILQGREQGRTLDQVLALMDARKDVFERMEKLVLPGGLRVVDLLEHPDREVRNKAEQVRVRFEAVMDQDRRLRNTFLNLLGEVGDELIKIQQSLKTERAYHPKTTTVDGVFVDRRG